MTSTYFQDECCCTCRFWQGNREVESDEGYCQRYAPRPITYHSAEGNGYGEDPIVLWPRVASCEECGEWEAVK